MVTDVENGIDISHFIVMHRQESELSDFFEEDDLAAEWDVVLADKVHHVKFLHG